MDHPAAFVGAQATLNSFKAARPWKVLRFDVTRSSFSFNLASTVRLTVTIRVFGAKHALEPSLSASLGYLGKVNLKDSIPLEISL